MAGIKTTMSLTDRVSGTLQKVHNTMNRVHSVGSSVSNSIKAQARAMYDLARASDVASQKMNKLNQASAGANLIKRAITGATIAAVLERVLARLVVRTLGQAEVCQARA